MGEIKNKMENKIIITNENEKDYWIEYKKLYLRK